MQIEPGEALLEWRGDGAVVLPEGEERGLELGERGEVVGVEHLALDDREVDLRLVQPTRMHGRMDDQDPVDSPELRSGRRPLQHPELMAQDEDLEVLGAVVPVRSTTTDEQTDEGAHDEAEERPHQPIVPG